MTDNESQPAQTIPADAVRFTAKVWVRESDLRFSFSRSSGPGGQAVNKVNTRAELRVHIDAIRNMTAAQVARIRRLAGQRLTNDDELVIHAQTYRSQLDNRRACVDRLEELVKEACRPRKRRKPTRPSRGAIERRLASKRRQSEKKKNRGKGWD